MVEAVDSAFVLVRAASDLLHEFEVKAASFRARALRAEQELRVSALPTQMEYPSAGNMEPHSAMSIEPIMEDGISQEFRLSALRAKMEYPSARNMEPQSVASIETMTTAYDDFAFAKKISPEAKGDLDAFAPTKHELP